MRDDEARLLDIVLACRETMEYVEGVSEAEFRADRKLQRALCMLLEIIGEAARAISESCKAAHPDLLTAILGRQVDLVEKRALRNPFRRHHILNHREVIYAT